MEFTREEFESFYNQNLLTLWSTVDDCPFCREEENKLNHILGGGQIKNPEVMFVLINPTYRNISSNPDYFGPRTPFLGVSNFWRVLVESGFLDKEIYFSSEKKIWSKEDIGRLLNHLKEENIYITNIVKCTGHNADLPSRERINYHLKLLFEEIKIVNPKTIITFGLVPFKALTGKNLKVSEHYQVAKSGNVNLSETPEINNRRYSVFPTYFPVGRGDFKKSVELLKIFRICSEKLTKDHHGGDLSTLRP